MVVPNAPVSTGNGDLHSWILSESRNLLVSNFGLEDAQHILLNAASNKGRAELVLKKEIYDALLGAEKWLIDHPNYSDRSHFRARMGQCHIPGWQLRYLKQPTARVYRASKRASYLPLDKEKQKAVLARYGRFTVHDLKGDSRNHLDSFSYWDLFGGGIDFPICCAREVDMPITTPLSWWLAGNSRKRMFAQQFIVPNPMLEAGIGGKYKRDCNTGRRMYVIVEFDLKDESIPLEERLNMQARLLYYLRGKRPLAMVVFSGSKSLHGWFPAYHKTQTQNIKFFREATELGADRSMWIPSQYCRMPFGLNRKTGNKQVSIYYDSKVVKEHNAIIKADLW